MKAVVIGASAGGFDALGRCLALLPESYSLPLFVVQHVHRNGSGYGAALLAARCRLSVREAGDKECIVPGTVYLAPPNYHLLVEDEATLALSVYDKVEYARPSIDVLFESASDVYGSGLVAIVLTGANRDGANGLRYVKENGGVTIVQDPSTAEYDTMPNAAISVSMPDRILSPEAIGEFLVGLERNLAREGAHR